MQNRITRKLVLSGLFAALIWAVTALVRIPVPLTLSGAYINAGDAIIYASAVVLGGPWAAAAAGIGSMFADLTVGAGLYAPATLVIKALMGLVVGLIATREAGWLRSLLAMVLAGCIMVGGYALFEFFLVRDAWIADIPYNLIQLVGGVVLGFLLSLVSRRAVGTIWKD